MSVQVDTVYKTLVMTTRTWSLSLNGFFLAPMVEIKIFFSYAANRPFWSNILDSQISLVFMSLILLIHSHDKSSVLSWKFPF